MSVGKGTLLDDSSLRDTIVGENCRLVKCRFHDSLIGNDVVVRGFRGHATLGDHGELTSE
ncbi:hypothetical protein D3C83_125230 [compost metagenome]